MSTNQKEYDYSAFDFGMQLEWLSPKPAAGSSVNLDAIPTNFAPPSVPDPNWASAFDFGAATSVGWHVCPVTPPRENIDEFLYFNKISPISESELYEGRRWTHCDHELDSAVCQIRNIGAVRATRVYNDFSVMTADQKSDLIPRMVLSRAGGMNKYMIENRPVCMNSFKFLVQLSATTIGKYASTVRDSQQGKHDNRNQIDRDKFKLWIEGPVGQAHGPGAIGTSHYKYAESNGHLLYTHDIHTYAKGYRLFKSWHVSTYGTPWAHEGSTAFREAFADYRDSSGRPLHLFKKRTDVCEVCFQLNLEIQNAKTDKDKALFQEALNLHLRESEHHRAFTSLFVRVAASEVDGRIIYANSDNASQFIVPRIKETRHNGDFRASKDSVTRFVLYESDKVAHVFLWPKKSGGKGLDYTLTCVYQRLLEIKALGRPAPLLIVDLDNGNDAKANATVHFYVYVALKGLVLLVLIHSNVVGHTYNFADLVAAIHASIMMGQDVYTPSHLLALTNGAARDAPQVGKITTRARLVHHKEFISFTEHFDKFLRPPTGIRTAHFVVVSPVLLQGKDGHILMKSTTSVSEPFAKVEIFKKDADRTAFIEQPLPLLHPGDQDPFPLSRETMESLKRLREFFPHDFKLSDQTYNFSEAEIKKALKRKSADEVSAEEGAEEEADDEISEADESKSQLTRSLAKVSEISKKASYFSSEEYRNEKKDKASQFDLASSSLSGLIRELIDATNAKGDLKRTAEKEPEVERQEQRPTKKKKPNEDAPPRDNELPKKSEEKEKRTTRKVTKEAEEAENKQRRDEEEALRKQSQQGLRKALKKSGHYKL